jgi:hypothetical protein
MSNGIGVADANPLAGADANSVESAAESFTRMLEAENQPAREPEKANSHRRSGREAPKTSERLFEGTENPQAPDTAPTDSGQAPDDDADEFDDPFLSDTPQGDDQDGEEDDADDAADETDDDDTGDDLDLNREVDVVVAGETKRVKLSEALAGYSREADYRQKTQRLADERREVEAYANEVVQERQQYTTALKEWTTLTAALEPSEADWDNLARTDPSLFNATRKQWDGIKAKVKEAEAELARVEKLNQQQAERQYGYWVQEQNEKLAAAVPALANPKKAAEFRNLIFAYGQRAGYSPDEIRAGAVDHRDVLTLYKAARYDEIVRSRKAGARNGKAKAAEPKPSATTRPRNVSRPQKGTGNNRAVREANARLQRTGTVEAAADAFTKMIMAGG